jgi:23S rRNA (cytosine1962-C5)-methyltransferase
MESRLQPLYLKPGEDRRVKRGHPWVYSNEVDIARSPLKSIEDGAPVRLLDANGRPLGTGFASPHSLICLRLMTRDARAPDSVIHERLTGALAWRERVFGAPYYRWAYGEGDGLPGLVVDRYGDVCVVQTSTWGMEQRVDDIVDAVTSLADFSTVVIKNDAGVRAAEGLPTYVDVRRGNGEHADVVEHDAHFTVPLAEGQKTGWFYDQRDNRGRLAPLYRDARVLDLFSYVGAWGIGAAVRGARFVRCVDSSARALDAVRENGRRNGVEARIDTVKSDVADHLAASVETYDLVVLDPPSLVPRRKDLARGQEHYRHLNRLALARVEPGGVFVSCSCSSLLDEAAHLALIRGAARRARRQVVLVGRGAMPADHPLDPMLPELGYLKCWFFRVAPDRSGNHPDESH